MSDANATKAKALVGAVKAGDERELLDLLKKDSSGDVTSVAVKGWPLLCIAVGSAQGNAVGVIDVLLMRKFDVNCTTEREGASPLYLACQKGNEALVARLLKAKHIDVNLRTASAGAPALKVAAALGHTAVVELLLAHKGVKVDAADSRGATALYAAAQAGHERVVELLLEARADPNASTSCSGSTPLHAACAAGHARIVSLLLAAGADPAQEREDGQCAIHCAVENCNVACAEVLVRHGAAVDSNARRLARTHSSSARKRFSVALKKKIRGTDDDSSSKSHSMSTP